MCPPTIHHAPGSAPWTMWGEGIEADAVKQMRNAAALPVALAGALMPDAHVGYGLPIGGVLATDNAVIPYAVGVDIACRMRLSILDFPATDLVARSERLINALRRETLFGMGAAFNRRHEHEVLDRDWGCSPITARNKDKAWSQLGTSGTGNHFVEFGECTLVAPALGLEAGVYLALLSHSGSRGTGAAVADHYSKLAMSLRPDMPQESRHLAWLGLDTQEGREYWDAMSLMGEYAAANHAVIHRMILRNLGAQAIATVENHHNFAWIERHVINGVEREVVVHRKGATPAAEGALGVIPGSMATPGFVVRGRCSPGTPAERGAGAATSLASASHGAGRAMSRTKARASFAWPDVKAFLAERGVTLLSAGLDEVPFAYKDIHQVMACQSDLVDVIARFDPRIVRMAPDGEKAED